MEFLEKIAQNEKTIMNKMGALPQILGSTAVIVTLSNEFNALAFGLGVTSYLMGTTIRTMSNIDINDEKPILSSFQRSWNPFNVLKR